MLKKNRITKDGSVWVGPGHTRKNKLWEKCPKTIAETELLSSIQFFGKILGFL